MLRIIFWVVILVLVLSFFGVSLRALVAAPATHDNFQFVWMLVQNGWNIILAFIQGTLAKVF